MKKFAPVLLSFLWGSTLLASDWNSHRQRFSESFPSLPSLPSSTVNRLSLSQSRTSDSFICTNDQFDLNPIFESYLIENSKSLNDLVIDELDDVELTLSAKGDSLRLTNAADFIHPKIDEALKLKDFNKLYDFLKESKDSEWLEYMTFYLPDDPVNPVSLVEIRRQVALRQLWSFRTPTKK